MKINIKGKSYNVKISEAEAGEIKIKVGEKEFSFNDNSVEKEKKPTLAQTDLVQKKDFKETEIRSPLAGMVLDIFVKVGAEIEQGDKIALLSAMKMENEILSESQGKVKEIKITKNQQVKSGEILVVLA